MVVSYLLSVGKTKPKSNRPYVGYLNRGRLFSYLGILVRFAPKYRLGSSINSFFEADYYPFLKGKAVLTATAFSWAS